MSAKKTSGNTVLLPIRVDFGKGKVVHAGQPVTLNKDFTKEDAEKIIAVHGEYKGAVFEASTDVNDALEAKVTELAATNKKLSKDLTDASKALANLTEAWHAVEKSMTAEDGTDEAKALEANVAALNALAAAE